jgi:large subunit ribosomal protein L30
VTDKTQRRIRVKWVRSGIGSPYRAKNMIRSLGLRRLHQVVERPDTPQIRGLVARIPRLVEIVSEAPAVLWPKTREYTIGPAEPKPESKRRPARPAGVVEVEEKVAAGTGQAPLAHSAPARQADKRKERAAASRAAGAKKQTKVVAQKGADKGKATKIAESRKKEEKRTKAPDKGKK